MSVRFVVCALCAVLTLGMAVDDDRLAKHVEAIRSHGSEPVAFVRDALGEHDLIVFDDAYHNSYEPWQFFGELLQDEAIASELDIVFIELLSRDHNNAIEAYLAAEEDDPTLLIPAFTNGLHGSGKRYRNLWDFLRTVREVNRTLPEEARVRVMGVEPTTYWDGMETNEDWLNWSEFFNDIYDYSMFRMIEKQMEGFKNGTKGIFLTNTRHAYKNIRDSEGRYYWNVMTFLAQQHPGKAYSVRINCSFVSFALDEEGNVSMDFVRAADGLWDSAFEENGNVPVAVPLLGTVFGGAPYVGNQNMNVLRGTTMRDANDAIVFLVPLEDQHVCGYTDLPITEDFKEELERRLPIRFGEALQNMMADEGASTVREYIDIAFVASEREPMAQSQVDMVGPIDAWKNMN